MRRFKGKKFFILLVAVIAASVLLTGCGAWGASADESEVTPALLNAPQNDDPPAEVSYVISFVTGTSEVFPAIETRVLLQSQIPTPDAKNKPGYTFEGWYLTSDYAGSKIIAGYEFTRNTTLYAKWMANTTIRITTAEELADIAQEPSGNYALGADIDLSQIESWEPIGGFEAGKEFSGTFDGNGYVISGMTIKGLEADEEFNYLPIGLFGKVTGTIRNVTLVDYYIELDGDQSRFYIGGIVGWLSRASMSNCVAIGEFNNPEIDYEGGIWDSLLGSYAEPTTSLYCGGAVGYVQGSTVTKVSTEGKITSQSNEENVYFGGVAGYVGSYDEEGENVSIHEPSSLSNCNSAVTIYGRYAGGLIGYNNGAVSSSFAIGDVSGSLSYPAIAGGLIAYNYNAGSINACYATGHAEARTAGGLVGVNIFDFETAEGGTISNCYASGDVFASEYAGGLVGRAVSDLPYLGRPDFDDTVYDHNSEHTTSATTFFMIENCLAYGSVEANASTTVFKDYEGNEYTANVFYAVFAGNFIGQAYELYIRNCIGFGNVDAISHRSASDAAVGDETYTHNVAYGDNFVGHSTALTSSADYMRVYVAPGVTVTRNGTAYDTSAGYNSVDEISYNYLNNASFYTTSLGFSTDYWNLNNLNVQAGVYPTLKLS